MDKKERKRKLFNESGPSPQLLPVAGKSRAVLAAEGARRAEVAARSAARSAGAAQSRAQERIAAQVEPHIALADEFRSHVTGRVSFASAATPRHLTNFLRNPLAVRWIAAEWFTSNCDAPYYAGSEFRACLEDAGYGDMALATRDKWGAVRAQLGRPRRLSPAFLAGERARLAQYRAAVARVRVTGRLEPTVMAALAPAAAIPAQLPPRTRILARVDGSFRTGSVLRVIDSMRYLVRFDDKSLDDAVMSDAAICAEVTVGGGWWSGEIVGDAALGDGTGDDGSAAHHQFLQQAEVASSSAVNVRAAARGLPGAMPRLEQVSSLSRETAVPLASLLFLLRQKELLLGELKVMNDVVEETDAADAAEGHVEAGSDANGTRGAPYDPQFIREYAWLMRKLEETNAELAVKYTEGANACIAAPEEVSSPERGAPGSAGSEGRSPGAASPGAAATYETAWYASMETACRTSADSLINEVLNDLPAGTAVPTEKRELVVSAVALLLQVALCTERALSAPQITLALYAASTSLRPKDEANLPQFQRLGALLQRFAAARTRTTST